MLTHNVEKMDHVEPDLQSGPPGTARTAIRGIALVLALVAIIVAVLLVRGWRPEATSATSDQSRGIAGMPTSAEIEATYGIRFTGVDVTAGGGMIQIRYQVLDSDKTQAIHTADAAPFVVDSHGVKYADPGMVGHSHVGKAKSPGSTDFILLANARGGVKAGSVVTIKVGALQLRNVPVA